MSSNLFLTQYTRNSIFNKILQSVLFSFIVSGISLFAGTESEYNGNKYNANQITESSVTTGSTNSFDRDFFKFTPVANSVVTITTSDFSKQMTIDLLEGCGWNSVDLDSASAASNGDDVTITFNASGGTEYCIGLSSSSHTSETYTLTLSSTGAANQIPTVNDKTFSTDENTSLSGNVMTDGGTADSDADGDTLTISSNTTPSNGTVTVAADGSFTYTPTNGFSGTDSFTYTVTDGTDTATGTVSITVNTVTTYIENADDLCYDNSLPASGLICIDIGMCYVGVSCTNTFPIKNIGDATLSNVSIIYDESGLGGSFGSGCGVNPSGAGSCSQQSNYDMGPFGLMGSVTDYTLNNDIPVGDDSNQIWSTNFTKGICMTQENFYATYTKNGSIYRGRLRLCSSIPDEPEDETIPEDDTTAVTAECDTFADMFQTRTPCVAGGGGSITFTNAGQLLIGRTDVILNGNDSELNTCSISAPKWVTDQFETCGSGNDCSASGDASTALSVDYANTPATVSLSSTPSDDHTNDVSLSSTPTTLSDSDYGEVTTSSNTNYSATFDITNQLRIDTLKMTNNNTFMFESSDAYGLEIGTLGIENNGADNSVKTDTNAKNIKIKDFTLASGTTVDFAALQTIKMETFTVGYGSTVTLKAQYVNINTLTLSSSGSGEATVTIIADYVDIGTLDIQNHSDGSTFNFQPYTPGARILFRSNTVNEGSNSTLVLDSGNYYVGTISLPGTSDVSAMRASSSTALINFYVNDDLTPGNNPGINSDGNNGNYGSNPAANFMLFVNGDITTGGGGTTFNATIYAEGSITMGNPTYVRGAMSANDSISVRQGQFTYDQTLSTDGWADCNSGSTTASSITGPFDAWDTFRGDTDGDSLLDDLNISTKVAGDAFNLVIASTNDSHTTIETKKGIVVWYALYDNNTSIQLDSWTPFDVSETASTIHTFTAQTTARKDVSVAFRFCADYNDTAGFTLYPDLNCTLASTTPLDLLTQQNQIGWRQTTSTNNFAIRPEAFNINIADNTQFQAGINASITFDAYMADLTTPTTGYNEIEGSSFDVNLSLLGSGLNCQNISGDNSPTVSFADGTFTSMMSFNNVGTYTLSISEKGKPCTSRFAAVDCNDADVIDFYQQGTNLSITDWNATVNIVPSGYNITGTYTQSGNNFTYLSNLLQSTDIYWDYNLTISAYKGTNTANIASNFTSLCFAQDFNLTFVKSTPPNNLTIQYVRLDDGSLSILDDSTLQFTAAEFNETVNGTANVELGINFDRNASNLVNPFTYTITSIIFTDKNSTVSTTQNINQSSTFFYGRAHASRIQTNSNTFTVPVEYEIYYGATPSIDSNTSLLAYTNANLRSEDSVYWYRNIAHVMDDGNITGGGALVDVNNSIAATADNTITNGIQNINVTYNGYDYPYRTTLRLTTQPWLLYNPYDNNVSALWVRVPVMINSPYPNYDYDPLGNDETNQTDTVNRSRRIQW